AEARCRVEERGAGDRGHGLFAGVDEVGVDLVCGRVWADPEDAVLGLQNDRDALGYEVGHECRQANTEVDVRAVGELLGRTSGHLVSIQCHDQAPSPATVRRSMRFSISVPTSTRRWTK